MMSWKRIVFSTCTKAKIFTSYLENFKSTYSTSFFHQVTSMFAYTNSTFNSQMQKETCQQSSHLQSSNSVRGSRPQSARVKIPVTTSVPIPIQKNRDEMRVSERFKNTSYNRQPSPKSRAISPFRTGTSKHRSSSPHQPRVLGDPRRSPVRERVKQPSLATATKAPVMMTHSDFIRKRLTGQCLELDRPSIQDSVKIRPKTAEDRRIDTLEDKVFYAIKDVLSRAVLENGKIDQYNINSIFSDMKRRLMEDDSADESSGDETETINISSKQSQISLHVESQHKTKPANGVKPRTSTGIIRKSNSEPPKSHHSYKKVYGQDETSLKYVQSNNAMADDPEKVVYINLPDSDYSKFNSIVKKEEERKHKDQFKDKNVESTDSYSERNKEHLAENKKEDYLQKVSEKLNMGGSILVEEKVGDCQERSEKESWKSDDDVKLQTYIEALIRNMNDQLSGRPTNKEFTGHYETEKTVCKSFCVCKVCVSNKSSKKAMIDTPQNISSLKNNQPKIHLNTSETKSNLVSSKVSKEIKKPLMVKKESNCIVFQKNTNFQSGPKSNITPRHEIGGPMVAGMKDVSSSNSFVVVKQEEEGEDFYLNRRMKKTSSKRPLSSKL